MDDSLKKQIHLRFKTALNCVLKMGKILNKRFYSGNIKTFYKKGNEAVTEYDLLVDQSIRTKLLTKFPDSWLSEESDSIQGPSGFEWVLDPIDGTNNFGLKIPFFCISLALKYNQKTVCGIVHDPVHQITYYTIHDKSFIKYQKTIKPAQVSNEPLEKSLVSYGFHPDSRCHLEEFFSEWQKIEHQSKASRRLGAAALEIVYVGIGKLCLYWIIGAREWDIAAGMLFAKNAGAKYIHNIDKNYLIVYQPSVEKEIQNLIELLNQHH